MLLHLWPRPPRPPLTSGDIDFVGLQDVRLNAIYFHVEILGIALGTEARETWLGARGAWTWSWAGAEGGCSQALGLPGWAGKGTEGCLVEKPEQSRPFCRPPQTDLVWGVHGGRRGGRELRQAQGHCFVPLTRKSL